MSQYPGDHGGQGGPDPFGGADPFGGGFDMNALLSQAQQMQAELMSAQRSLEAEEVTGSAGGGLVTALVTGTGELISLQIARRAVDPDDPETLADLVVAAVRDASSNAKELAAQRLGPMAGGMGGPGGMPDFMMGGAAEEDGGDDVAPTTGAAGPPAGAGSDDGHETAADGKREQ